PASTRARRATASLVTAALRAYGTANSRGSARLRNVIISAIALCLLGPACGDPVHDERVAALGPEDRNVPPGPLHRPGQPCLLCHSREGEASAFLIAGTVYLKKGSPVPYGNATVLITDAASTTYRATTNCAGNFLVR